MSLYLGENLISGVATPVEPSRNIGQIIPSTIPLTDAGLHLLDGALIQGSGIYSAFVTAMAAISVTNPELFCTEQEWQQSVTDYGVCGKFVYDSVNNTLRLQKFYSAERYLIASSSNGTQWCRVYSDGWCEQGGYYANSSSSAKSFTFLKPFSNNNYYLSSSSTYSSNGGTDHQESMSEFVSRNANGFTKYIWNSTNNFYWKACGYIDISTYKQQTQYQYIVIATSTKTDIQVDIDQIATDLNGKADVDLSNCTKPHIVETYKNGTSWYRVYSDGWCEQGGVSQSAGDQTTNTISLLKNYTDTNYYILFAQNAGVEGSYTNGCTAKNKTTSSFVLVYRTGGTASFYWQASGYIR